MAQIVEAHKRKKRKNIQALSNVETELKEVRKTSYSLLLKNGETN